MLIPKVLIHGSIRPLPRAFVSAIRLKFRLPMEMSAADSVCSSRAPTQNSSNPTLLRQHGDMLREHPIIETTNARPCFDVGSIDKNIHPNIPLMKYFVPFKCSSCARWRADNRPAQFPEMSVETFQLSIVNSAVPASEACNLMTPQTQSTVNAL